MRMQEFPDVAAHPDDAGYSLAHVARGLAAAK
jgi:hypothetical protein